MKKHRLRSTRRLTGGLAATFAGLALVFSQSAQAAASSWSGLTLGDWNTGSNWTANSVPTLSDDLTILGPGNSAGALTINIASATDINANTINFTDTAAVSVLNTSLSNRTLTLQAGLTTGSGAVTIGSTVANQNVNVALGGSQTWNVGSGGLTVTNVVSGSGAALTKSGAGTLTLSGANTYTGGTVLSNGTISIVNAAGGASTALGTGTITLNGGTLDYTSNNGGQNGSIANAIVVNGSSALTMTRTFNVNGNISGSGSLTIGTAGNTLAFGGTNNSGYTGTATFSAGAVDFQNAGAGSVNATWVFNGGNGTRISIGAGNTINFGSISGSSNINQTQNVSSTISVGALNTSTSFTGTITNSTGTLNLTKVGSGTLTLSGANTYTGLTTINAGTLALGAANRLADTSNMVLGGGTFATGGFSETVGTLTINTASVIDFGSGTSALAFANSSAISWTGTLTLTNFDVGTDTLKFGTDATGLTGSQLSAISLTGYTATGLSSSGFVQFTAVPEPHEFAIAIVALLGVMVFIRRRNQQV